MEVFEWEETEFYTQRAAIEQQVGRYLGRHSKTYNVVMMPRTLTHVTEAVSASCIWTDLTSRKCLFLPKPCLNFLCGPTCASLSVRLRNISHTGGVL